MCHISQSLKTIASCKFNIKPAVADVAQCTFYDRWDINNDNDDVNSLLLFYFQLLGHLLIVAKNVAKQESLTDGYRVGKIPHLLVIRNLLRVNYKTLHYRFCPLQWLMMEGTVLSQFTIFMCTCWEEDKWCGHQDNSVPVLSGNLFKLLSSEWWDTW